MNQKKNVYKKWYQMVCLDIICLIILRNLHKWVQRLKAELPYYDECNAGTSISSTLSQKFSMKI
jgi:hypothetical protein